MKKYTTVQGDTWDMICYRLYPNTGGEMCMDKLIAANSGEISRAVFPAGVTLNVPEIEAQTAGGLPPWKK